MIHFCNVCKDYSSSIRALENINLKILKGEMLFLVGVSGAGKTTMMRLLFKEEEPTNGQILVGGRNIGRMKRKEVPLLRRKVGMVFQDFQLLEELTVFENVAFAMEVLQYSRKDINKTVPRVLEQVGILNRSSHFPRQLSGGEKQRVGIARAIVNKPAVLLADEPTGNVDPDTSWEIIKILEDISLRGTTVVVATHDRDIVDSMNRRVVTLSHGRIISDKRGGYYSA